MVAIIAGVTLTLVVAITLPLFLLLRKRQRIADRAAVDAVMARINEEADAALEEIQRTAKLALDDIDERYQDILFLYNLLEEKKKELAALIDALQAKAAPKRKSRIGATVATTATANANSIAAATTTAFAAAAMNTAVGVNGMNAGGMSSKNGMNNMNGIDGVGAIAGISGLNTVNGINAVSDVSGLNGVNGTIGVNGIVGASGVNGNGISGTNVIAGASASRPRVLPKRTENARYGRVRELLQQGLSIQEIAKMLDMGQGEVKLIMELTGT